MKLYRLLPILTMACAGFAAASAQTIAPSLINPRLRLDPPPYRMGMLRFLTSDDNPPFNFTGPDGNLAGYNIDLARAICGEIKVACTIQVQRSDLLLDALTSGAGDALIPAPANTSDLTVAVTFPYLPRPGRFAARRSNSAIPEATSASLGGQTVGVVADSPHATFLSRYFPETRAQTFATRGDLFEAFGKGETDLVFADAAELAFWLNGVSAGGCCAFLPGAFLDAKILGQGSAIATRATDDDLRRTLDSIIARLDARGTMTELYLRYFPVPLF